VRPGGATLTPGLYFDARNYRQPDVLVYRREAVGHRWAGPADTLLAVEIVSPGSISTDRVAKPAQYAAAGIPYYWRIELDPLVLVAHVLDGDSYRVAGTFTDEVVLAEPVSLRFRLSDLLP